MKDAERPTLTSLGLTKRISSEAQALHALPEEVKEAIHRGEPPATASRRRMSPGSSAYTVLTRLELAGTRTT